MLRNYFRIAIRSFINQKYYSLINTLGLALGTAACILILLFVEDELSYEKGFRNNPQIYRLVEGFPLANPLSPSATVPFSTTHTSMTALSEITDAALIYPPSTSGRTLIITLSDSEYHADY